MKSVYLWIYTFVNFGCISLKVNNGLFWLLEYVSKDDLTRTEIVWTKLLIAWYCTLWIVVFTVFKDCMETDMELNWNKELFLTSVETSDSLEGPQL